MSSNSNAVPSLPIVRTYVRHLLAFGVSVGVGLAPLLGEVDIPGFTAILSIFPLNLRRSLIPFAAFLMALPAVAVQFYSTERAGKAWARRWFATLFVAALVLTVALWVAFTFTVEEVTYQGTDGVARYVVGTRQLPDCPCQGKPLQRCVGEDVTFSSTEVEACFDPRELRIRKLPLSLLYMALMVVFGAMIGAIILRQSRKATAHAKPGSAGKKKATDATSPEQPHST